MIKNYVRSRDPILTDQFYEDLNNAIEVLGYTLESEHAPVFALFLQREMEYICNFCNIKRVPEELYWRLIYSVRAFALSYLYQLDKLPDMEKNFAGVKQIQEGDVTYTFAGESEEGGDVSFSSYINRWMGKERYGDLVCYRKLRW